MLTCVRSRGRQKTPNASGSRQASVRSPQCRRTGASDVSIFASVATYLIRGNTRRASRSHAGECLAAAVDADGERRGSARIECSERTEELMLQAATPGLVVRCADPIAIDDEPSTRAPHRPRAGWRGEDEVEGIAHGDRRISRTHGHEATTR